MKKHEIISDVDNFIRRSLQHKSDYLVEIAGKIFWVNPQVFSPKYSYSSTFIINHWDIKPGMEVLDMGTGTGILAIFAASEGASKVIAVDINQEACNISNRNINENKVEKVVSVIQSDLYSKVPKQLFDRIIFNAPYWNRKADPYTPLTYALFDEDYRTLQKFLEKSKEYLKPNGKIILGFSEQDGVKEIRNFIRKTNLIVEREIRETKGHTRIIFYLSLNHNQI